MTGPAPNQTLFHTYTKSEGSWLVTKYYRTTKNYTGLSWFSILGNLFIRLVRNVGYMLAQPFPEHTYPEAGVENFDALAAGSRNYSDSVDFLKSQIWILCNIHPPLGSKYVASQTMLSFLPQALTRPFESLYSKVSNATTQAQLRKLCLPKFDELILDDETEVHNMVQGINI